jgi:hypothetical protein
MPIHVKEAVPFFGHRGVVAQRPFVGNGMW